MLVNAIEGKVWENTKTLCLHIECKASIQHIYNKLGIGVLEL